MTDYPAFDPHASLGWIPKFRNQYQLDLAILATIQQAIVQVVPNSLGEKAARRITSLAASMDKADRMLAPDEVMQKLAKIAPALDDMPELCPPLRKLPPLPWPWPYPLPWWPPMPPPPWPWPPPGPKDVVPVQAVQVTEAAQGMLEALGDRGVKDTAIEILEELRSSLRQ